MYEVKFRACISHSSSLSPDCTDLDGSILVERYERFGHSKLYNWSLTDASSSADTIPARIDPPDTQWAAAASHRCLYSSISARASPYLQCVLMHYSRLSFFLFDLKPLSVLPPSSSIAFPVICADPMLERKSTTPAKSDGWPTLPEGWPAVRVSMKSRMPKAVIRPERVVRNCWLLTRTLYLSSHLLGNTPGQIQLTVTWCDISLLACILERWIQAAFEGP